MKSFVLFTALMFCTMFAFGQSPYSILNSHNRSGVSTEAVSAGNLWIGSGLGYTFNNDNSLASNFLFRATTLYVIPTGGALQLPIMGNVTIPFQGEANEVRLGAYPYTVLPKAEASNLTFIVHGALEYALSPDSELDASPQSFRVSAGVEGAFSAQEDALPITLSVAPAFTSYNLDRDSEFGLETTLIVPIGAGLGLLVDLNTPFSNDRDAVFGVGVVINRPVAARP